jgi:hypothetical protein
MTPVVAATAVAVVVATVAAQARRKIIIRAIRVVAAV